MVFIDYFFVLISVFGSYTVGISLFKAGPLQSLILGLLIQGLILGLTIWVIPSASILLLLIIQASAFLYSFYTRKIHTYAHEHFMIFRKELTKPSFYIALMIALTLGYPFTLHEYPFNSHDSVYWGYVFESLHADYSGPIRSPVLAPLGLPVTHLLPAMSLTVLLAYIPNSTLLTIVAIKSLVIVLFFWRTAWFLLSQINREKLAYGVVLLVSLVFIFESELGYNLMVSSFIYEIILLELIILLSTNRLNTTLILILFLTLITARASLTFAAIGAFGILAWHFRKDLKPQTWLIGGLAAANVGTWLILPKPLVATSSGFLCGEAQLTFVNPFSLTELAKLSAIGNWVLPSSLTQIIYNFIDHIQNQYHLEADALSYCIAGLFLAYTLLKFFLPVLLWVKADFIQRNEHLKFYSNSLLIYLALLWGGMFIIRIGGVPDHQFHGFLVLAIFSLFALFRLSMNSQLIGALVVSLGILSAFYDGISSYPFSGILSQGIQREHLNYEPDASWTSTGPIRLWHEEVKVLAAGKQRTIDELDDNQFQAYFAGEPADVESIASLWTIPTKMLQNQCEN
jgi:hypothetical protein